MPPVWQTLSSFWLNVSQTQPNNEQPTKTTGNASACTGQQVMLHKREDDNRVILGDSVRCILKV